MTNEDINKEVHNAFEVIKNGGIILYPTDTVWGIGCDATSNEAVKKIYELKQREESKSMIVLMNSDRMMYNVFKEIPEVAWEIIEVSDNTLGVRLVKDPFCYKLMERMKKPLVSTSANIAGMPTPNSFKEIDHHILDGVDYVVNLHHDKIAAKPSTIIKLGNDLQVKVIRP